MPVADMKLLLGQYADDTDSYMKTKAPVISAFFSTLDRFCKISGFAINYDKTTVYRIGNIRNSDAKCYTQKNLHWTNDPVNVLRVIVHEDEERILELNYNPLLDKAKGIMDAWRKRNVSLIGKVAVVNTLIASLFVYRMTALRTLPDATVKRYKQLVSEFLWNGKKPKISWDILCADTNSGGLKLCDLKKKDKALKITWIQILQTDEELSTIAYNSLSADLGNRIWSCNLCSSDVHKLFPSSFWTDILQAWCEVNYDKKIDKPPFQGIWGNSHLRSSDKPIIWRKCIHRGLFYVHQLYPKGTLIGIKEAHDKYSLNLMELNILITALPKAWRESCRKQTPGESPPDTTYKRLVDTSNLAAQVYNHMVEQEDICEAKRKSWERDLHKDIPKQDFRNGFRHIFSVTNVTKLRSFQYRLLQRAIITNIALCKWGIVSTPMCSFCHQHEESILHILIHCRYTAELWIEMEQFMNTFATDNIHFDIDTVIWNRIIYQPKNHIKNTICLIVKQFIYKEKCAGRIPRSAPCKQYIRKIENNEKYYAVKNNKLDKHLKKWYPTKTNTTTQDESTNINNFVLQYIENM